MKKIFKVVAQSAIQQVTRQDGTLTQKCTIVLQEFGGKYENSYVCNLIGNSALVKFYPGDIVLAALTFKHNEYQGKFYQDINVQDIEMRSLTSLQEVVLEGSLRSKSEPKS